MSTALLSRARSGWHLHGQALGLPLATLIAITPVAIRAGPESIPLRCRMDGGPWQDCRMRVDQPGTLWSLKMRDDLIMFRHDGSGQIKMQRPRANWVNVEARWTADAALCWDGICAKGEIPLD